VRSGPLSVAVVVVSCDKYSDLWGPCFALLDRFWPQRPGPTYLVTNELQPAFAGVTNIPVGPDVSWSDNLLKALEAVREEYVVMVLEDLFLCEPVDLERLSEIFAWAHAARPNQVRLNPTEPPYLRTGELVGEVPPGAPYRTTTVMTLWKKDVLRSLLRSGENAWQFEIDGSERSDCFDGFYSTYGRCFAVINGVIRGKWQRFAVQRLRMLGIAAEVSARPVMTSRETLRVHYIAMRARAFKWIPWRHRRTLRRLLVG
jgi:hypothetical protein